MISNNACMQSGSSARGNSVPAFGERRSFCGGGLRSGSMVKGVATTSCVIGLPLKIRQIDLLPAKEARIDRPGAGADHRKAETQTDEPNLRPAISGCENAIQISAAAAIIPANGVNEPRQAEPRVPRRGWAGLSAQY